MAPQLVLSAEVAETLGDCLGVGEEDDRFQEMMDAVCTALTANVEIFRALENAPRPSQMVAAIKEFEDAIKCVVHWIRKDLDSMSKSQVNLQLSRLCTLRREEWRSLDVMAQDLSKYMLPACRKARASVAEVESRGRPPKLVLKSLVAGLCRVFDRFFDSTLLESDVDPALGEKSPPRRREFKLDFVSTALDSVGEAHPKGEALARLFPSSGENMS